MAIRIAIIGFGKIARDEHLPAIRADPRFELVAVVNRSAVPSVGVPAFADTAALLAAMPGGIDAVAICTGPDARHGIACEALRAGLSVLLEKPPAATLGDVHDLVALAAARKATLFAGWHSQAAPAVQPAAALLAGAGVRRMHIDWCEDVRRWHPGQDWIWEATGFGVFDAGINALSIATAILPERLLVRAARLQIPGNRQAPIAAELTFAGPAHTASFDWRARDGDRWTIDIETDAGRRIELLDGGARLSIDGVEQPLPRRREYPVLYERFAALVAVRETQVDIEPMRIVADAFMIGRRDATAPFTWTAGI